MCAERFWLCGSKKLAEKLNFPGQVDLEANTEMLYF